MELESEAAMVVGPLARRSEVMCAGHRCLVGGHISHNRMATHLKQSFTWPGLDRDVRNFLATCPECHKVGKALLPRVPMVETPINSVPYHRMAFDIVGPLKRTKQGYDHILTAMCMGTRYPYCVPLKRVHAMSVAEGLMEVLSHTGIPVELLTDQGAVIKGRVCRELGRLLNIKHITTTAYHPLSNGALEVWHGCLKGKLRKSEGRPEQWALLLEYCVLAYRATPHTANGFYPLS